MLGDGESFVRLSDVADDAEEVAWTHVGGQCPRVTLALKGGDAGNDSVVGVSGDGVLASAPGLGKTMIGRNVAHQAVLAGHSVVFITAAQMLNDLAQQDSARSLQATLRKYTKPWLLCMDEVGYLACDARAADLLFEVVNRRYEHGSILLTTNLAFQDWPKHFPGAACVTAMIERLTHHAEILTVEGKSYRLKEAGERQQRRTAKPAKP